MPSPVTLIDEFIEDQVAAGNSDSYVVDEWVPWALRELRRGARRFWDFCDWDFRHVNDYELATIADSWNVPLPANFLRMGPRGKVHVWNNAVLVEKPLNVVNQVNYENGDSGRGDLPRIYCVTADPDNPSQWVLSFAPWSSRVRSLHLTYEKRQPTISYDDDSGLEDWPDDIADLLTLWLQYRYEVRSNNFTEAGEHKTELYTQLRQHASRQRQDKATIEIVGDQGLSDLGMW
jgi:hypothetical protein